jgi:agmatine deiminase
MPRPPAEWARQAAIWVGFPSAPDLWEEDLEPARAEVAALARQLAETVPVSLVAADETAAEAARAAVPAASVHTLPFGDIWLRDTAPIFLSRSEGVAFRFNGWGGKYDLPHDTDLADRLAAAAGAGLTRFDLVAEGGAIDMDGLGLGLTTEQCLLNANRNPGLDRRDVEAILGSALGIRRLIWLGEGLMGDHTDGHVDNLARFAAPGTVLIPVPAADDPNAAIFEDARARARSAGLLILDMPSVGRFAPDSEVIPASYMNFVIANGQVVVPQYGAGNDGAAIAALKRAFPRHKVTGLPSTHILTGGGSFHCITQQQPEATP